MSTISYPISEKGDKAKIRRSEARIVDLTRDLEESYAATAALRRELNERNTTNPKGRINFLDTISKELHIEVGFNRTPDF